MNPNGINYNCSTDSKADKAKARQAKVKQYIKQGMTRTAAIQKAKK